MPRLSRKPAAVEECLLFRGGGTAEHGVAVREAAEPADDVGVMLGPFDRLRVVGRAVEGDAALLVGELFRMLERQVEEHPLGGRDELVEAARDRARRDLARQRIGREGAGISAEHVARKLVEHDQERERALRISIPGQLARGRSLVSSTEVTADLGVEAGVLLEPFVRPGGAPEGEHGLRAREALSIVHGNISTIMRPKLNQSLTAPLTTCA